MKTKTHGGRIRPMPSPSRRSPRLSVRRARNSALPILLSQENGNDTLQSTCVIFVSDSDGDNEDNEGMIPESSPQTVKNGDNMTPQMTSTSSEDSMELDNLEGEETCFRCKGRDKHVMVCSEIGCLIAVHGECMGCESTFDDLGLFYCPYCKHRRSKAVALEMRKRVMAAKEALLNFLEGNVVGEDKEKENDCDYTDDRNECDMLPSARDGILCNNENVHIPHDLEVQSQVVDEKEMGDTQDSCHDGDNVGCGDGTAVGIDPLQGSTTKEASNKGGEDGKHEDPGPMDYGKDEKIDEGNQGRNILDGSENAGEGIIGDANVEKRGNIKLSRQTEVIEEDEEQIQTDSSDGLENTDDISETESLVNRHRRFKQRAGKTVRSETVTLPKRSSPRLRKAVARQKSNTKKNPLPFSEKNTISEKSQQPLKLVPMMDLSNTKRRRLHWTAEEEEMLRDGVQKFSITSNIVLPWKKILDYGRHVFDPSRTPVDLKDKWRNLMAKEGASIKKFN